MNKEHFLQLHKQYSVETPFLSFVKRDHPAYVEMLSAGAEAIPWLLERLQDSVGREAGADFDVSNCLLVSLHLLGELTDWECCEGLPDELLGHLAEVREFVLAWGQNKMRGE